MVVNQAFSASCCGSLCFRATKPVDLAEIGRAGSAMAGEDTVPFKRTQILASLLKTKSRVTCFIFDIYILVFQDL